MRSKEDQAKLDLYDKYFNQREEQVKEMVGEIDILWEEIKAKIIEKSNNDYDKKSIFDGYYNTMLKIKKEFTTFKNVSSWEESVDRWTKCVTSVQFKK